MGKALIIGCGGVAGVAIHKCCQNSEVFEEIMIASRTKSKCDKLKEELKDIEVGLFIYHIEDYKQKRVETLEEVAKKKASIVERTGKMITLEPMKAYERKIIHSFLQNNPNIETRSIGQEPKRRIVITKK